MKLCSKFLFTMTACLVGMATSASVEPFTLMFGQKTATGSELRTYFSTVVHFVTGVRVGTVLIDGEIRKLTARQADFAI